MTDKKSLQVILDQVALDLRPQAESALRRLRLLSPGETFRIVIDIVKSPLIENPSTLRTQEFFTEANFKEVLRKEKKPWSVTAKGTLEKIHIAINGKRQTVSALLSDSAFTRTALGRRGWQDCHLNLLDVFLEHYGLELLP